MLDAARWAVLAAAASLPFSTALTNLAMVAALLAWMVSREWIPTARAIVQQPAAWTGWLLFAALAAGISWSLAPAAQAAATLWKYRELLFFGLVMYLFADLRWRQRLLWVLFGAALVLLVVSFAALSGLVQAADAEQAATQGAVMNKSSITHSFMMSLLAFVAGIGALRMRNWPRAAFAVIALLAAINVLAAVPGRTGYVVLAVLAAFLAVRHWRWKGVAGAMVGLLVVAAAAYQWVPSFAARIDLTLAETQEYQVAPKETSMGMRLHFLKRSLQIVGERPLVGAGTGGWGEAFYEATAGDPPFLHDRRHTHPHNEYLNLAVQLGLGGLLLFAGMLGVALWRTRLLPEPERLLAQGVVVAFAVGCLFNDFILDSTEGHIWAVLGGALFGANVRREPWRARS